MSIPVPSSYSAPISISGQVTRISGQTVVVGAVSISGQQVSVTSGSVITVISPSSVLVPDANDNIILGSSGGTTLVAPSPYTTDSVSLVIRNNSGNAPMYVGSSRTPPYSGRGFLLGGGDGLTLNVNTISNVKVFAVNSGNRLSYIWSQL